MDEIIIDKIEWTAPEYKHEDKSMDFLWAIGVVTIVVFGLAIWKQNYLFSIFILISGASLVLFSVRRPQDITYKIETGGLTLGKDYYEWKKIKGFHVKKKEDAAVLLIEIDKYMLPVYTLPLPIELIQNTKESLAKIIPDIELEESKSMKFMEKLGF